MLTYIVEYFLRPLTWWIWRDEISGLMQNRVDLEEQVKSLDVQVNKFIEKEVTFPINKFTLEGSIDTLSIQDSGHAKIATIREEEEVDQEEDGIWFSVHSWNENDNEHPVLDALIREGSKVRITLEVISK